MSFLPWLRDRASKRPWWMNGLLLFCAYMAFVYVPWDIFVKPVAEDEEVWFGVMVHGTSAKWLALPHWLVYALGCLGFWRMRAWMWPWAALYCAQVAIAMFVWPLLYGEGSGRFALALLSGGALCALSVALWRARPLFERGSQRLVDRYEGWALVTGASAGIGEAFARRMAEEGLPCILVARREERLRELSDELERRFEVETRVVAADLRREDEVSRLLDEVDGLEIGVLVNNAGVGYRGRFDGQETGRLRDLVAVNCLAPVLLTGALLPGMRKRGRGAVIFVGSIAGSQPLPLHALYGASKAFANQLGEALWGELRGTGVDALVVTPGATETEFQEVAGELRHPGGSADAVVDSALAALGDQPSVIPGWFHWIRANAGQRLLPRSMLTLAAGKVVEAYTPDERR